MKAARDIFVLTLAFVIVTADQLTKVVVRQSLVVGESRPVIPGFLNLTRLRNTGAVWGILQHQNMWLVLLSVAVLVAIALLYRRLVGECLVYRIAVGCMIGGIVGNLIDRIKLGWVTDFLDFYWSTSHWPAFNIADSSICVGVAIYLVSTFCLSTNAFVSVSSTDC